MGKKMGFQKRGSKSTNTRRDSVDDEYDDEIDAFHKQRNIVPLDVNDDDTDESDEDDVEPVFDLKGVDDEDSDQEEDDDDDDEEDGDVAKMIRSKKYLQAKFGAVDEEMADDDEKNDEDESITWGGKPRDKHLYHGGDNADFELQSSDEEDMLDEETEAIRLRTEQTKNITAADAGLEDDDTDSEEDSDRELTMEEMAGKGNLATRSVKEKKKKDVKETDVEVIEKDLNSLSKKEQMEVVNSSAPEVVLLLSRLNDAVEELETKINPILTKLKEGGIPLTGGMRYLEVKQVLLLTYCQSITFFLLLKAEGQPSHAHPVVMRLVEIKYLLDQIKELDGQLPPGFEEALLKSIANEKVDKEDAVSSPDSSPITQEMPEPVRVVKSSKNKKKKGEKRKHQVDVQSEEMLKLRAALEGKLRSNRVFDSTVSKPEKAQKRQKLSNRKLETFDDYIDDADNNRHDISADKLTNLVSSKRKSKIISGDDDLPTRDDIGERRRKYELRILAEAGVKEEGKNESEAFGSDGDNDNADAQDDDMVDSDDEGEDELYKQVKQNKLTKRAAKSAIYSREPSMPGLPETVDGKRVISNKIMGNRGLTRQRNKDRKNPRKNYKLKAVDKNKRRKGQVRTMRKYEHQYGGENTGINVGLSRSIRFKN